jgi:hypothetical protein
LVPSYNPSIFSLIKKWKETYELSFELADVTFTILDAFMDYCKSRNIPLNEEQGLWNLVIKARSIFKEIEEINSPDLKSQKLLSDGFLQRKKSDGNLTEPKSTMNLSIRNTSVISEGAPL